MNPGSRSLGWCQRVAVAIVVIVACRVALGQDSGSQDDRLARMEGSWGMALSAAEQEQLGQARAALEGDPDDAIARNTVALFEDVMAETALVIEGSTITGMSGDSVTDVTEFTVAGSAGDILILDSDEGKMFVRFDCDGTMVWTSPEENYTFRWRRTDRREVHPPIQAGRSVVDAVLRARRAEAPTVVGALRIAELAYHAEWDSFLSVENCPPESAQIGLGEVVWQKDWPCYTQLEKLGWLPDWNPRCRYRVEAEGDDFVVSAECDVDGDGVPSIYEAARDQSPKVKSANDVF